MKSPQMSSKSGGKSLCTVCGDESSGFHYGVDSCEGCKGFFRRCITQGMSHKCANEEKCEITPFTRNSCQYCRLKKCFEVGMSREASRLGRRPKRLKEVGGESSGGSRTGNLPIAPYPAPQDMNRLRMEELQKILHSSGSLKDDLLQAFVSVAKASFQEHSKTGEKPKGPDGHYEHKTMGVAPGSQNQGLVSTQGGGGSGDGGGGGGGMSAGSSAVEARSASVDSVGQGAGGSSFDVDSPSSLHSPGGSCMADLSLVALDSFLFEQSQPGTPAGGQPMLVDGVGDLQSLGSPYSHHPPGSVGLDSLSTTASPLSELNTESLLPSPSPSSLAVNGRGVAVGNEAKGMKTTSHNATPPALPACLSACSQLQHQHQQYLPPRPFFMSQSSTSSSSGGGDADIKLEIKVEQGASFSPCHVKTEPVSPETSPSDLPPLLFLSSKTLDYPSYLPAINVKAIVEEVQQTPTETRRLLIEQVTNAVVDAHLNTTLNTREAIDRAKKDIKLDLQDATRDPEKLKAAAGYMWQQFVSAMAPEITNVVRFCRKLPGFVEIEQEDQIRLIKQGSFEVMMTRFALLVDSDTQTLLDPTLTVKCPRYVIQATPMGEFLDEFFCVAAKFKPLKLTDGEVGLFTSVLIVCPSRKGLKNESAIGKIQSLFQQALYILIKHNHPDAEDRFSRLMELVAMFRRVNEEHYKAISDIRLQTENNQFPELHKEVFDNSHHF